MFRTEERKLVQDKLILLNGKELADVNDFIDHLIERRRRLAESLRDDIIREHEQN